MMRSLVALLLLTWLQVARARASEPSLVRLTLEQALERARQVAPSAAAESEVLRQRRAEAREARHQYLPTASLYASETLGYERRSEGVAAGTLTDASHAAGAEITATLLDFGRRGAGVEAADFGVEVQQHVRRKAESDAILTVAGLYLRILANAELIDAREANAAEQRQTLQGIRLLVDKGLRPGADVTRAQADVSRAEIDARLTREQHLTDMRSLAVLLGLSPRATLTLVPPPPRLLQVDFDSEAAVADATRLDPEIAAARAASLQANAEADAAHAAKLPVLGISGKAGLTRSDAVGTLDATSLRAAPVLSLVDLQIGASLRWNLLDAGIWDRASAASAAARAQHQRLLGLARTRELDALSTVHAARQAVLLLQRADEQYALAELSVQQERERYRVGEGSLLQLLDAQRLLHDARLERIEARVQRDTACVRLRLLTHGGTKL